MSDYYQFDVPGAPVAKGRPRAARAGPEGRVRVYTPQKSARFEERVRLCAMEAGVKPLDGPLAIFCWFQFPPKGSPRKGVPRPADWKTTRPDLSNLLKSVEDGLAGVGYADDAQIVWAMAMKYHGAQGSAPKVTVRVQREVPVEDHLLPEVE